MSIAERARAPIAFSHYSAPNDISGVTTWLRQLLLHLHAQGVPLVVLLHHLDKDLSNSSLLPVLRAAGIHVEIVARAATMEEDVRSTIAFLDRHKPALFLPQCLNAMYYAAAIAGEQGLPWVLTMHSDDPDYWAIAEALPPERHGGHMVCVSKHITAQAVARKLARTPVTIPYGVKVTGERATFSSDPFTVAYCGRLVEEQKRASLVIRTLIAACEKGPHMRAVVMGDGKARATCEALVKEANMGDRIRFTGAVGPEAVHYQLMRSQALLLMSDYEGLPVALLEAMALGVVPVVRDIPSGVPELVKDGISGALVNDDPSVAAERLWEISNDPERWSMYSSGAHELVRTAYNLDRGLESWSHLLKDLQADVGKAIRLPKTLKLPLRDARLSKGYRPPPSSRDRILQLVARYRQALVRRISIFDRR